MKSIRSIGLYILSFLLLTKSTEVDKCNNQSSCHDCIQDPGCAWNLGKQIFGSRCQNRSKIESPQHRGEWYNPPTSILTRNNEQISDTIRIKPQNIKVALRPQIEVGLEIAVKNVHSTVLELKYTSPEFITVTFKTNCNNSTEQKTTNKCENVSDGEIYTFTAIIEATCPQHESGFNNNQSIRIFQADSDQSLTIETEVLCSCPCESPENIIRKAAICHFTGNYKCGICECDQGFGGKYCECQGNFDPNACINPKSGLVCSGRGSCVCGKCLCNVLFIYNIYGQFCEHDNYESSNGKMCAGEDHGDCVSGQCICKDGWTGAACTCTTKTDGCRKPDGSNSVCSGNGRCVCGLCMCRPNYLGLFCEKKTQPNPFL